MSTQEYYRPKSLAEATSLLGGEAQGSLILAGGTLAMPLINDGISMPEKVLGLKAAGLDYINETEDYLIIGATTTLSRIAQQKFIPMLAEAALGVGGWAIRNMATAGGNFFAPPPGGDFATSLLALDAELVLVGRHGERKIPVREFYTGFMTNVLQAEEIIKEIQVEIPHGKAGFNKFGRRHANTPSIVSIAVYFEFDSETVKKSRIALNAVGPYPIRARKTEEFLVGKKLITETINEAGEIAVSESTPFTDPIATEWYRRKMIPVMLARTLEKIRG